MQGQFLAALPCSWFNEEQSCRLYLVLTKKTPDDIMQVSGIWLSWKKLPSPQNDCQNFYDSVENIQFMRFHRLEATCHERQNHLMWCPRQDSNLGLPGLGILCSILLSYGGGQGKISYSFFFRLSTQIYD